MRSLPDVSPARGASLGRASERNSPNFRGVATSRSCPSRARLILLGAGAAAAPGSRAGPAGLWLAARKARGTSGCRAWLAVTPPNPGGGAACVGRPLGRALRPADLSAGNRCGTELGLESAAWDRGEVSTVTLVLGWRLGEARFPHRPHPRPWAALGRPGMAWKPPHAELRASCNPSRAGFRARGLRSGGAAAFFRGRSLGKTQSVGGAARVGKRAAGPSPREPVRGAPAPRTTRRAGAEGWVFAGEMRVSVQLAYKVPVLGSRDPRLL